MGTLTQPLPPSWNRAVSDDRPTQTGNPPSGRNTASFDGNTGPRPVRARSRLGPWTVPVLSQPPRPKTATRPRCREPSDRDRGVPEILGELGRSGMGVVYHGQHTRLNHGAALKVLLGGADAGQPTLIRFLAEAEAVAGSRLYTYVDRRKVRSPNPGYCFKVAGWRNCGVTKARKLAILERGGPAPRIAVHEAGTR